MSFNRTELIKVISGVMMTFFFVRMFVQFLFSDFISSLSPGWYIIILPEYIQYSILSIYILAGMLNVVVFYNATQKANEFDIW